MFHRIVLRATMAAIALVLLMLAAPASHANFDSWDIYNYVKEDQGTWAAYYRSHARVRLGPEQRLPNGVSWRLHTDVGTGLAMPRITWMPDARRMRTANALFDMAQGAAMLVSRAAGRELDEEQARLRLDAKPIFQHGKPVVQTDVGLTYATSNLVSFIDLGYIVHEEGNGTWNITRGLTFDLAARHVFGIEACSRQRHPLYRPPVYGHEAGPQGAEKLSVPIRTLAGLHCRGIRKIRRSAEAQGDPGC